MILPWLQVDEEAFERGVELAAVLGIEEAQAVGHLVLLWRWTLSRPADAELSGLVSGASAVVLIEAGVRWRGARGAFLAAVIDLGLVVVEEGDHRVRGLERYREQLRKRAEDRERKAQLRSSEGSPAEVHRTARGKSGQTQTQTQTQISLPSEGSAPVVKPVVKRRKPDVSDADPRHQPMIDGLCRVFAEVRGAKMPFSGRDTMGVKALLHSGQDPVVILAAWRAALNHRGYPTVSTPGELHQHLAHFVGAGPPARAADGRAPVAVPDWSTAASGEIPA